MDIQKIIDELIDNNIINSNPTEYKQLKGGTVSDLYLINVAGTKYVIKSNTQQVIKEESKFLKFYENIRLFPNLIFIEPTYRYIVYSFIKGTTNYTSENKKEILQTLVKEVLNNYQETPESTGWGWAGQPADSWRRFQLAEVSFAKDFIGSCLDIEDHRLVYTLAKNSKLDSKQYFLHGDCGVHNFIFENSQLKGVIDPTPVIGDPMYDLVYAFCSSPDDLTRETIDLAARHLKSNGKITHSILYEQVLISLYIRLETTLRHDPADFEKNLKAWDYWKGIIKNT